jgi:hypothetical protein
VTLILLQISLKKIEFLLALSDKRQLLYKE